MSEPEELVKWIALLPKMIRLFDRLLLTFPDYYGGRIGKLTDVQIYDEKQVQKGSKRKYRKTPVRTPYLGAEMKYSYPQGWIYPLYAAFRFLAAPDGSGNIAWREDPVAFWDKYAKEITSAYVQHIVGAGYDGKKVATNPLSYQSARQKVTDLFKSELLLKAGISI